MHKKTVERRDSVEGMTLMSGKPKDTVWRTTCDQLSNLDMIVPLAWNDFRTKYAGSVLGLMWAFAGPVVTVVMYWSVFQVALGSGPVNGHPFALWLVAGLVPWMFFQDALNYGVDVLRGYSFLVKKISFNISILPAVRIFSAFFVHASFLLITLLLFTLRGTFPGIHILQLFYYSFCTIVLTLGLVFFASAIAVFFRDIVPMIAIILQVGMWATPILWNIEIVPDKYKWLVKLNPMTYIVEGFRNSIYGDTWFFEHFYSSTYFWIFVVATFCIGTLIFKRSKPHFADVL